MSILVRQGFTAHKQCQKTVLDRRGKRVRQNVPWDRILGTEQTKSEGRPAAHTASSAVLNAAGSKRSGLSLEHKEQS